MRRKLAEVWNEEETEAFNRATIRQQKRHLLGKPLEGVHSSSKTSRKVDLIVKKALERLDSERMEALGERSMKAKAMEDVRIRTFRLDREQEIERQSRQEREDEEDAESKRDEEEDT